MVNELIKCPPSFPVPTVSQSIVSTAGCTPAPATRGIAATPVGAPVGGLADPGAAESFAAEEGVKLVVGPGTESKPYSRSAAAAPSPIHAPPAPEWLPQSAERPGIEATSLEQCVPHAEEPNDRPRGPPPRQ